MKYGRLNSDKTVIDGIFDVDQSVVDAWIAARNPKAEYIREFIDTPSPSFDPATQIVEQHGYTFNDRTTTQNWVTRQLTTAELEANQASQWKRQADAAIASLDEQIAILAGTPTNAQSIAALRVIAATTKRVVQFIKSGL